MIGIVVLTVGLANVWAAEPDVMPEPVQYWRFDDGSGISATNSIVSGNTGTLFGPAWVTSGLATQLTSRSVQPSTAALDFTSPDYVNAGNVGLSSGSGSGEVTLSMWVRPDVLSGDDRLTGQLSGPTSQAGVLSLNPADGRTVV